MKTDLFSLENYTHALLFEKCEYPWQVFSYLDNYLKSVKLKGINPREFPGVYLINPEFIFAEEGVIIEPGAYIQGPCILEKGCVVRHGAYIRGQVIIGERCVVGHGTEVKRSLFLNDACAAHFNYVGDSILGNHVNLGAGTKCANLRLDRKSIRVEWNGARIDTGLTKLGALIGDQVEVGCNCVLNPGTILERGSVCYPCLNVLGTVPKKGVVKSAVKIIVES